MLMKDINLENLTPERKRCVIFAKDGNTVIKKMYQLYCVEKLTHKENHYWAYFKKDENGDYIVYNCLGDICIKCGCVPSDFDFGKFEESIEKYPYSGIDGFVKMLEIKEEKGHYINKVEIEVCYLIGNIELYANYKKYQKDYIIAMEEKERAEKEAENKKREEDDAREREEVELKVREVETRIKEKKEFRNFPFYNSTIILFLMKKYGIKIPIKTQGWINKALSKIWFDDGRITYNYYKTSKDSAVFYNYLLELERKILEVA